MATHCSVLSSKIPGTVESGGLPSMGLHRVGHDWSDLAAEATGIPSPPLDLFVVMLSEIHLTLHSRMFGSRCVITPSCLFVSLRSFSYSSVYSYHLFLVSSASVKSIPFLLYCAYCMKCSLGISNFLEPPLLFASLLFSYLWGLLREPFCLFAFPFLGDDLDHCHLCNVTNLHP